MRVVMHEQGGFLDIDRRIEVDDATVRIAVRGVEQSAQPLPPDSGARVRELATKVCALQDAPYPAPTSVSDDMRTRLDIDDGAHTRTIELSSGADAPLEVWELVAALDEMGAG